MRAKFISSISPLSRSLSASYARHLPSSIPHVSEPGSMLSPGQRITGQCGRTYKLICPLGTQRASPNVWQAVDNVDQNEQFVVKGPSSDDDPAQDWPLFQHELQMQKLFGDSPFIRQMVDFVLPTSDQEPILVLQAFEKTLWTARTQRPMTVNEIKWIMKAVLLGLWTVHRKGLVYTDLKMENVLLNGFDKDGPGDVRSLIARIADCGTVTAPSNREITSISYRSPEVYFHKPWTASTDIWSWGIMYCHLLEAQVEITQPGMYDSICQGTLDDKASAVREALAFDFDLYSNPLYAKDGSESAPSFRKGVSGLRTSRWMDRLRSKGVTEEDVDFLSQILDPNPEARWTARDIIASGYLEID